MAEILFIGSGTGIGGTDHFAPKYLVGNVPAGDSPAGFSFGGFTYIPDMGNCAGIAAAAALAAVTPGDIYLRPGTYDFNAAGSPAGPITIPDSCRVSGMGVLLDPLGGPPLGQIIGRTTGDQGIFVMGDATALRDLAIVSSSVGGAPFAGSTALIEFTGAGIFENAVVLALSDDPAVVCRTCVRITGDAPTELFNVFMQGSPFDDPDPANWTRAVHVTNPDAFLTLTNLAIAGWDVGVQQDGGNLNLNVTGSLLIDVRRRGVLQLAPGYLCVANSQIIAGGPNCIAVDFQTESLSAALSPVIEGSRIFGFDAMTTPAVIVHGPLAPASPGGRVRIQGNAIAWTRDGAAVELGESGTAEQVDRCSVEHNVIVNLGVAGVGVEVSNAGCNRNIIGGGSIEAATQIVDGGTLTQTYPIA